MRIEYSGFFLDQILKKISIDLSISHTRYSWSRIHDDLVHPNSNRSPITDGKCDTAGVCEKGEHGGCGTK